jgi:hypothetical protein
MTDLAPPAAHYYVRETDLCDFQSVNPPPTPAADEKAYWRDMHRLNSPRFVQENWPRIVIHEIASTKVKVFPPIVVYLSHHKGPFSYGTPKWLLTGPTSSEGGEHLPPSKAVLSSEGLRLVGYVYRSLKSHSVPKEMRKVVGEALRGAFASSGWTAVPNRLVSPSERGLLSRVRRLDEMRQTDAALDLLYDGIDEKLRNGAFEEVDSQLSNLRAADFSCDILLGLLTATLPAKAKLPHRDTVLRSVESTLRERGEYEEGLLTGL